MEVCEFEEKQFENALTLELAGGSVDVFASGQVLETLLGYDVALRPDDPRIWELLNAGLPPGVLLDRSFWSGFPRRPKARRLPPRLVSLILQVKRCQYLDHWRAGQHDYWRGAYFRFYVGDEQQRRLYALERAVGSDALVRYVAPAFTTYGDLCKYQSQRALADRSAFAIPADLVGHRLWSYRGPGTHGYANPEGEETSADNIETLLMRATDRARAADMARHVTALARSIRASDAVSREQRAQDWVRVLEVPPDRAQVIRDWAVVVDATARCGGAWLVLGFD